MCSARRVARQLGHSDCVVRRCWDQWIPDMLFTKRPGSGCPRQNSPRENRHNAGNAPVPPTTPSAAIRHNDESRFNVSSDGNRIRVWRPLGERLCLTATHTTPTAGVMIWSVIAYNTRSPLVLIRGPTHESPLVCPRHPGQPHVGSLIQQLLGTIFEQDNVWPHTVNVSEECLRTVSNLPCPVRSPDLSPIQHIWVVWDGELDIQ
ncbi:transposable element Tcb2 transposase [Trichonephila clavipes]|nr:transposable element Tcb2 transposase [Trichonephila clavipes]